MRIREDGKLVVHFRTEARFRGQFVAEHPGTSDNAMVMSQSHPELQMSLNLIRSEATYNNPEQKWSFVSDYAVSNWICLTFSRVINPFTCQLSCLAKLFWQRDSEMTEPSS